MKSRATPKKTIEMLLKWYGVSFQVKSIKNSTYYRPGQWMTPEVAQKVISHYNDSLKAFFKNPSYEKASAASIDSFMMNNLRSQIDATISNTTGEGYRFLKDQYGALSSMEKDVAHRAIVHGRQNPVGLAGNIGNVASGAELVRGLITLNPADLATSGAIKGFQAYMKYLNNPDTGITRIFNEIQKAKPSVKP